MQNHSLGGCTIGGNIWSSISTKPWNCIDIRIRLHMFGTLCWCDIGIWQKKVQGTWHINGMCCGSRVYGTSSVCVNHSYWEGWLCRWVWTLQDAWLQHCCKEADCGKAIGFSGLGPFLLALLIIVSLWAYQRNFNLQDPFKVTNFVLVYMKNSVLLEDSKILVCSFVILLIMAQFATFYPHVKLAISSIMVSMASKCSLSLYIYFILLIGFSPPKLELEQVEKAIIFFIMGVLIFWLYCNIVLFFWLYYICNGFFLIICDGVLNGSVIELVLNILLFAKICVGKIYTIGDDFLNS